MTAPAPGLAPLLAAAEMRAAEAAWFAAGHDSFALMQVAAAAVAKHARAMLPGGGSVRVLAGPGNNGGDGMVAAHLLAQAGHRVEVVALSPDAGWKGDAARARALWAGPVHPPDAVLPEADLVIDALFGIGLARPLDGAAAALAEAANAGAAPVLAVDIPSGVDSDTGAVPGPAIRATATVTFHCAKPGHLLLPGRLRAGALHVADIGLPPSPSRTWRNGPWRLPEPEPTAHKYARGGALVWSGPELATGAARLAASAALRGGAGAVALVGDAAALRVHAAQVTAIMLREGDAQGFARLLADPRWRAACVGPGAGPAARCAAGAALQSGRAVVLDADALTAFAGADGDLARLVARHDRPVVLTPHEGEFARLFPHLRGSRLARARAAAAGSGAVIVLKGPDTVIAAPDGRAIIEADAPAHLATAGSGDVLAGFVTALLAQGMAAFEAAAAAVWLHGAVARHAGRGLTAEDLLALGPFQAALREADPLGPPPAQPAVQSAGMPQAPSQASIAS